MQKISEEKQNLLFLNYQGMFSFVFRRLDILFYIGLGLFLTCYLCVSQCTI